jgi:Ca2+-transporting ATPase
LSTVYDQSHSIDLELLVLVSVFATFFHRTPPPDNTALFLVSEKSGEVQSPGRLFSNSWLCGAVLLSPLLQVAVVYITFLQQAFSTVSLSPGDWLHCAAVASSVLWLRELGKVIARATSRR